MDVVGFLLRSPVASSLRAGDGQTLADIAESLNRDGVATARGGARWYPSTVNAVLTSAELDDQQGGPAPGGRARQGAQPRPCRAAGHGRWLTNAGTYRASTAPEHRRTTCSCRRGAAGRGRRWSRRRQASRRPDACGLRAGVRRSHRQALEQLVEPSRLGQPQGRNQARCLLKGHFSFYATLTPPVEPVESGLRPPPRGGRRFSPADAGRRGAGPSRRSTRVRCRSGSPDNRPGAPPARGRREGRCPGRPTPSPGHPRRRSGCAGPL